MYNNFLMYVIYIRCIFKVGYLPLDIRLIQLTGPDRLETLAGTSSGGVPLSTCLVAKCASTSQMYFNVSKREESLLIFN